MNVKELLMDFVSRFSVMNTNELIAQISGLVVTLICIISPQFKKKWQMVTLSLLANLLSGVNFLLLGEFSACGVTAVALAQCVLTIRHDKRDTSPGKVELSIYGVLYVAGGFLPYLVSGTLASFTWVDVMPIIGALLFLGYLAQKQEQRMRLFGLSNATVYFAYDIIIGSTQVFAQLFGMISTTTALLRYRKKKSAQNETESQA